MDRFLAGALLTLTFASLSFSQDAAPATGADRAHAHLTRVNALVLDMAQDFPEDKYGYRLTKEMRSFGEVIVHILSGNIYGARAGRGEKANWDEVDPKKYATKAEIVAAFKQSIDDCEATRKQYPDGPKKNLEPWMSVFEHSAEHYGLLVAYYRANGLVPPDSRPKSK